MNKYIYRFIALVALVFSFSPLTLFALDNGAYLVSTTTSYANPATGKTADGGSNMALGESMCRSVIGTQALLEVEDGRYYVTLRVNLMSNLSSVSFEVQNAGGSYQAAASKVMASNSKADTADYRFEMSDLSKYISPSMYVTPMGRSVKFYVKLDTSSMQAGSGDFVQTVKQASAAESTPAASEAAASSSSSSASSNASSAASQSVASSTTQTSSAAAAKPSAATSSSIAASNATPASTSSKAETSSAGAAVQSEVAAPKAEEKVSAEAKAVEEKTEAEKTAAKEKTDTEEKAVEEGQADIAADAEETQASDEEVIEAEEVTEEIAADTEEAAESESTEVVEEAETSSSKVLPILVVLAALVAGAAYFVYAKKIKRS